MDTSRHAREYLAAALFLLAMTAGMVFWLWEEFVPKDPYAGMTPVSKADVLAEVSASSAGSRPVPVRLAAAEPEQPPTREELEALPTQAEESINGALDASHLFIQLYGGTQRLLGRRILEDVEEQYTVYQLSDGSLTFINAEPIDDGTLSSHAEAYLRFQDLLEEREIPLLYLQAPQKIGREGAPTLPPGVTDYGNQNADRFLARITAGGADVLDLRDVLEADAQPWTSYFFTTDHHWKPETALLCVQKLVELLNEDYGMALDPSLTDPSRYHVQVYEDIFLGSQGKRTGSLYAGLDDLTVLTPDFETDFTHTIQVQVHEGTFEQCLLFLEQLEQTDPFQSNPYTVYSGGDYSFSRIINHLNPDGPKIMILRDSFGCVLTPFLAMHCSDLSIVDLRYFYDYFPTYLNWLDPDMVLLLYSPGNLTNDMAFDFFSEIDHDEDA